MVPIGRSVKGHGYYRIKKQYVPEPGVEEERYLGWYQAGGHAFDPNSGFMPISGPIHGYQTAPGSTTSVRRRRRNYLTTLGPLNACSLLGAGPDDLALVEPDDQFGGDESRRHVAPHDLRGLLRELRQEGGRHGR